MRRIARLGLSAWLFTGVAFAADHADGPGVTADPTADVADVYTWMAPGAGQLNLVMTLPSAATKFSDQVHYVFHTTSKLQFGDVNGFDLDVICDFAADQTVACWAGDTGYAAGNPAATRGISGGGMRVFAGSRNDPFFFNLAGFRATTKAVVAAAPGLTFDPAGCPALDAATATALVTQLRTAPGGGPALDNFVGRNALTLVVQIDRAIVNQGGPIIGVWGATYRR